MLLHERKRKRRKRKKRGITEGPPDFSCVFEATMPFKSLINTAEDLSPFE